MKHILFICLLSFIFFMGRLNGQDCSVCNAALRQDVIQQSSSLYESASLMLNITKEEFEVYKQSNAAGISFPILSDIIRVSDNYDVFKSKMTNIVENLQTHYAMGSALNYYSARTSPVAYDAWGKCVETNCNEGSLNITLRRDKDYESDGFVMIKWTKIAGSPSNPTINVTIDKGVKDKNGQELIEKQNIHSKDGIPQYINFKRSFDAHGKSHTTIIAEVNRNYSAHIESDYVLIPSNKVVDISLKYWKKNDTIITSEVVQTCHIIDFMSTYNNGFTPFCHDCWDCLKSNIHYANRIVTSPTHADDCPDEHQALAYYTINILAPSPYQFSRDMTQDDIRFIGPGAGWNNGHCKGEKSFEVVPGSDGFHKAVQVAVGNDWVNAFFQLPASGLIEQKPERIYSFETADPSVVEFEVDNTKLVNTWYVNITFIDGSIKSIDASTHLIHRIEGDKTIFTVPTENMQKLL